MQSRNTTPVRKPSQQKPPTGVKCNNSGSKICYRVEPDSLKNEGNHKTVNNNCKITEEVFTKLTELMLNDETKEINCKENKAMKCKKCYCVCCNLQSKPISTFPPSHKEKPKSHLIPTLSPPHQ